MNRNFKEAGSALLLDGREGEISHRYMLGLYHVLEAVTSAFPHVLFENCAGGGGRFDAGMLYYMPQTWTIDDTDGGAPANPVRHEYVLSHQRDGRARVGLPEPSGKARDVHADAR